jgi:uncharacterized protein
VPIDIIICLVLFKEEETMINDLKKMMMKAKVERDSFKSNLLSTLISEAVMIGKNDGNRETTESEILAVIKKFLKGVNENISLLEEMGKDKSAAEKEKEILESLLPKQMDEAQMEQIIVEIIEKLPEKSTKMMGQVMGELKKKYDGQYDAKTASSIVKNHLMNN